MLRRTGFSALVHTTQCRIACLLKAVCRCKRSCQANTVVRAYATPYSQPALQVHEGRADETGLATSRSHAWVLHNLLHRTCVSVYLSCDMTDDRKGRAELCAPQRPTHTLQVAAQVVLCYISNWHPCLMQTSQLNSKSEQGHNLTLLLTATSKHTMWAQACGL